MRFGLNAALGAFWAWWTGELVSLIPSRVRSMVTPKSPMVAIRREGRQLLIGRRDRVDDSTTTWVDIAGLDDAAKRSAATRAIARQRRGSESVAVVLSPEDTIRSTLQLPAAAAENLREVLGYEMDSRTPFSADEVYYDFRITGTDRESSQIKVDLAVVPKEIADRAAEEARGWGISPVTVALADNWENPDHDFVFLSDIGPGKGSRLGTFSTTVLTLSAVTLAAAWGHLRLEHLQTEAELLSQNVAVLKKEASASIRLKAEIEALSQQRGFSQKKKKEQLPVVITLNRLTKLVPDDSWLIQFQIRGKSGQIQGYSPDASRLVELIEGSPSFRNATFRSRVTRDARSGAQRFHIVFEIVPGA